MPGGQFGGAGATGRYRRPFASGGGWRRSAGSRLFTRRRNIQGGHGHIVSSWSVPALGSEGTAVNYATNVINPGQWLDKQWFQNTATYLYEGNLQPTRLIHGEFRLTTWSVTYQGGVQLYLPTAIALVIIPWYDSQNSGDPTDWVPTVVPHLLDRSFGRQEIMGQPNDPSPLRPFQRPRIIHRWWGLSDHTDLAYGNASKQNKYSWTLRKPINIRNNEALWLCCSTYNTNTTDTHTIGWQLGYTIGFTHRFGG